jgi:hypothetical protein
MNRAFVKHLFFMILGYALAVSLASAITVFIKFAPTVLPDNGAWGSAYKALETLPVFLLFGALYTTGFALPGWLISIVIAERRMEQRKYWFGLAGIATATLAHLIALLWVGKIFAEPLTIIGSIIGGFAGGLVYWAIAGKKSGVWKVNDLRAPV